MEEDDDPGKQEAKVAECNDNGGTEMSFNEPKTPVLSENGVVFNKELMKSADLPYSEDEVTFTAVKRIKLSHDDSSIDTAETIKKIQAFIALGKADDFKKDPESPEKQIVSKPSKSVLELNENQDESGDDLANNITELQRTLQGLDDSQDNSDHSISRRNSKTEKNDRIPPSLKENHRDIKPGESSLRNNDLLTPSRVSKRIQSKSIKFSAKKMLRGDDATVLKRMIPGYEKERTPRKDRGSTKSGKTELKKVQILGTTLPPDEDASSETESVKPEAPSEDLGDCDKPVYSTKNVSTSPKNSSVSTKPNVNMQSVSPASPDLHNSSASPEHSEKIPNLSDQLEKFAVTNGKITLELKSSSQRKVVRIAVPPKASSPLAKASLGPDIIIKRVKPVKKTIALPENVKEFSKIAEKEIDRKVQSLDQLIKISPSLSIDKLPVRKLKEDIVKIQKNIIKSGKTDEIKSNIMSVKYVNLQKPLSESITDSKTISLNEEVGGSKIDGSKESKKEIGSNEPSLTQQIAQALESAPSSLRTLKEDSTLKKFPDKPSRGRKPSKFAYSGNKLKAESSLKKVGKIKEEVERSPSVSDVEDLSGEVQEEEEFKTLFDRYFSTSERYIEHHDSLDSDSSTDFDSEIYTHFINLKHHKNEKKLGEATVYDLMHDISIELPTWNIHASSNGDIFYLVQIDSSEDKPLMKKVVELDLDNNAKVYIDNKLVPRYEGNYSSYEDIRQLIYDIDRM